MIIISEHPTDVALLGRIIRHSESDESCTPALCFTLWL